MTLDEFPFAFKTYNERENAEMDFKILSIKMAEHDHLKNGGGILSTVGIFCLTIAGWGRPPPPPSAC